MAEDEKSFRYRAESCLKKKVLLILMTKRKRILQDKKGL